MKNDKDTYIHRCKFGKAEHYTTVEDMARHSSMNSKEERLKYSNTLSFSPKNIKC